MYLASGIPIWSHFLLAGLLDKARACVGAFACRMCVCVCVCVGGGGGGGGWTVRLPWCEQSGNRVLAF